MSNGDVFLGEVIGTAILILFGAGVVAAVVLNYSKAKDAGFGSSSPSAGASVCWPGRTPPPRCPAGTSTPP